MNTILVTGAAGFIGSNLVKALFKRNPGQAIVAIDNMNDYYDVSLKEERLKELVSSKFFRLIVPCWIFGAIYWGVFKTTSPVKIIQE